MAGFLLIERVVKSLETRITEFQGGFREESSCVDQTFPLNCLRLKRCLCYYSHGLKECVWYAGYCRIMADMADTKGVCN